MIDNTYAKAYTEVLEILKYLPSEEYERIPKEKIDFYRNNKDNSYNCTFDSTKSLNEQKISREARAIIVSIFRDFFCTPTQREKLQKILLNNEQKYQEELRKKYNPDNIFRKKKETTQIEENIVKHETAMIEYKKSIFKKIIDKIKRIFHKKLI